MARKVKNVALDRAQEKAKKQKRLAIILCGVLALDPRVRGAEDDEAHELRPRRRRSSRRPRRRRPRRIRQYDARADVEARRPSRLRRAASAARRSRSSPSSRRRPTRAADRVRELREQGPVPPVGPEDRRRGSVRPRPRPKTSTAAPDAGKTGATPPAPPAPPPTVGRHLGQRRAHERHRRPPTSRTSGAVFQQAGIALFHLVSLTQKSAKVAIAGGSYADGAPALTLTVGTAGHAAEHRRRDALHAAARAAGHAGAGLVDDDDAGTTTPTTTTPASIVPSDSGRLVLRRH